MIQACLPCCCSASPVLPVTEMSSESPLAKKTCLNWHLIPSLVVIVTCVTAVSFCVLRRHYYLSAPFGVGGLCGLYSLYVAHQYHQLRSFEENNDRLEVSVTQLEEELKKSEAINEDLNKNINQLKQQNGELDKNISSLEKTNQDLKTNLETLTQKLDQLELTKQGLEGEVQRFIETNQKHESHIQELNKSLTHLEQTTSTYEAKFETTLQCLRENTEQLSQENSTMAETAILLQAAVQAIDNWKNNDSVQKNLKVLSKLHKQQTEAIKDLGFKKKELEALKCTINDLNKKHEELLKEEEITVKNLNTVCDRYAETTEILSQAVKGAAKIIKKDEPLQEKQE